MRTSFVLMILLLAVGAVTVVHGSHQKDTIDHKSSSSSTSTAAAAAAAEEAAAVLAKQVSSSSSTTTTTTTGQERPSMCERIHPEELPEECICDDSAGHLSLVIICVKPFNNTFLNDTLGIKLAIEPCDEYGSSISFNITERNHHIDYRVSGIRAGEEMEFPIPGLSIAVPTLGHAGLDVAVLIAGNPDQLTLRIGLDACVVVRTHTICASSIPGLQTFLPWWILSGTYSFGDICNTTTTTTAAAAEAITSEQ